MRLEAIAVGHNPPHDVNVVIEVPIGGEPIKYEMDKEAGTLVVDRFLHTPMRYPGNYGFVPHTLSADGDPIDVLILMDEPAFVGCLVAARLIGVIEAEQTEGGETTRNDRLLAVAEGSRNHKGVCSLEQLGGNLVDEVEHFFVSYNAAKGKRFVPRGRFGPDRALQVVEAAERGFAQGATAPPGA